MQDKEDGLKANRVINHYFGTFGVVPRQPVLISNLPCAHPQRTAGLLIEIGNAGANNLALVTR